MSPTAKSPLLLVISSLSLYIPVYSSPTNQTDSEPPFVPEPKGRGTISLLTTCVVTLSICVWTAIHMNIEPPGRSRLRKAFNKIGWAGLALIAPEVVLWRAYSQWKSARKLCKLINSLPEKARFASQWSMENGFFAVMGGYRIRAMKDWPEGCTLAPKGVYLLARLRALPEVDKETILDRSNADDLVKGLACLQALWMIIQVIARKASGFPITLLELNTVAHVVCAITMYILWRHKPQNVNQAEFVNVEPELEALLSWRGPSWLPLWTTNGRLEIPPTNNSPEVDTATSDERFRESDHDADWRLAIPENKSGMRVTGVWDRGITPLELSDQIKSASKRDGIVMLLPGERLEGTLYTALDVIHLTTREIQHIKSISQIRGFKFLDRPLEIEPWPSFISARASNIIIEGDVIGRFNFTIMRPVSLGNSLPMLAMLSIFYGGIHASSWNGHFPTAIEQRLWRIASCIVAGGGLVLWAIDSYSEWAYSRVLSLSRPRLWELAAWQLVCVVISLVFAAARLYIVIEAFMSVRSLPIGAFNTVTWVNFLPHLG